MKTFFSAAHSETTQDLAGEVRQFVLDCFPLARKRHIKNSDALLESGIFDSQGVLDVVSFIEQRFSTTIEDEELVPENFQTIERIAAFIRTKSARSTGMA
jgi:acyl carrier protein